VLSIVYDDSVKAVLHLRPIKKGKTMKVTVNGETYLVKWFHRRKYVPKVKVLSVSHGVPEFAVSRELSAKGGVTECYVIQPNGAGVAGIAKCSEKDNYCKSSGRKLALADALDAFKEVPHTPFWEKYLREVN
jgi:hypothetical protein